MRDDIQIKFSRIKNWKNKEEEDENSSWKTIDNTWKIERIILIALIPVSLLRITWLVILLSVLELLCITRFIRIEQRYFDWDHATKSIFGDKENEELKEKLRLMEKELEEAKASSNHWEQKYTDLVHRCNQYESVLRDFDYTTEQIIDNFNDIVCGIRIPCSEGFIRKNYKEMNFTESGELPVYIYKSEILKHISSFISAIRSYSKDYISVIQDPITINRADRKLFTRALKALRKYYSYFKI